MPTLTHSLFNPNQLCHFGTQVQDNPYDYRPMSTSTSDQSFTACIQSKCTNIYLTTWAPTQADLEHHPYIPLYSSKAWNPREVHFPKITNLKQEEIELRNVQGIWMNEIYEETSDIPEHCLLYTSPSPRD